MGQKVKPYFRSNNEDQEQQEFENELQGEISDATYQEAISIFRKPRDKQGHSEVVSFRANPMYLRIASELSKQEPAFKTVSDFNRTAYRLGCSEILKHLKKNKKVGDQIDDLILALEELEQVTKSDQAYRQLSGVLDQLPKTLKIYTGNRTVLKQKLEDYRNRIEKLRDPFWRDLLRKKFNQKVQYIGQENDFYAEDGDDL